MSHMRSKGSFLPLCLAFHTALRAFATHHVCWAKLVQCNTLWADAIVFVYCKTVKSWSGKNTPQVTQVTVCYLGLCPILAVFSLVKASESYSPEWYQSQASTPTQMSFIFFFLARICRWNSLVARLHPRYLEFSEMFYSLGPSTKMNSKVIASSAHRFFPDLRPRSLGKARPRRNGGVGHMGRAKFGPKNWQPLVVEKPPACLKDSWPDSFFLLTAPRPPTFPPVFCFAWETRSDMSLVFRSLINGWNPRLILDNAELN